MTVRCEIAEPRRETGARSSELGGPEAYLCSTVKVRGASPPAVGSS